MDRRLQIVALGVGALALAGGGFAAGAAFGPRPAPGDPAAASPAPGASAAPAGAQGRRAPGGAQGAAIGGQLAGRVISVGDGSITIETRDASGGTTRSVIALVGSSTRVVKTAETEIKLTDIKPGDQVAVVGQADATTGTVSATAVVVGGTPFQQLVRPGASPSAKP